MKALSELFDETRLLVPCYPRSNSSGEVPLEGHNLSVTPLGPRRGSGVFSKASFLPWLIVNCSTIITEIRGAEAIHAPIPGDVGTVGMVLACALRKPLFVRHCGNWLGPVTVAEKLWCWFMEAFAGGRNIMLATGGTLAAPSRRNPNVRWIFSSSLTRKELASQAQPRAHPSNGRLRLVLACRQERAKGAGTVIQSLPLLAKRFPKVNFEVIGEGSAVPEFKQLARETGVLDRVRFSGKLNHEQVLRHLRDADLFPFPTVSSDGFPKAVLEALASGLPVVATRVSVLSQLLSQGCGVLLDQATPEALARGIEAAMSSASEYEAMSRKAIETARQYSLEAWRDEICRQLEGAWGPLRRSEVRGQRFLANST
jgi:Glycosyl transferases group 1